MSSARAKVRQLFQRLTKPSIKVEGENIIYLLLIPVLNLKFVRRAFNFIIKKTLEIILKW